MDSFSSLKREKMRLEQEKSQKEADLKIQNGEVATLQKELDSINLTVIQLSAQKGTAQMRLDELDDKVGLNWFACGCIQCNMQAMQILVKFFKTIVQCH